MKVYTHFHTRYHDTEDVYDDPMTYGELRNSLLELYGAKEIIFQKPSSPNMDEHVTVDAVHVILVDDEPDERTTA